MRRAFVGACGVAEQMLQARAHRAPQSEACGEECVQRRCAEQGLRVERAAVDQAVEVDDVVFECDGWAFFIVVPVGDYSEREMIP